MIRYLDKYSSPSHESAPGYCYSMRYNNSKIKITIYCIYPRIALGNHSDLRSTNQMEKIKVFLHPKGSFKFYIEQDSMPNSFKIYDTNLQYEYE